MSRINEVKRNNEVAEIEAGDRQSDVAQVGDIIKTEWTWYIRNHTREEVCALYDKHKKRVEKEQRKEQREARKALNGMKKYEV